jgi:hypothetical protein
LRSDSGRVRGEERDAKHEREKRNSEDSQSHRRNLRTSCGEKNSAGELYYLGIHLRCARVSMRRRAMSENQQTKALFAEKLNKSQENAVV